LCDPQIATGETIIVIIISDSGTVKTNETIDLYLDFYEGDTWFLAVGEEFISRNKLKKLNSMI
jgi:hypothetical protein